jgi:hypothetical protein
MRSLALCLVVSSVVACGDGSTDTSAVCGGANECGGDDVCSDQGDGLRCYGAGVMDGQATPADAGQPDPEPEPEELDPCQVDNGGCAPQATCTSRDGSPECGPCPAGYRVPTITASTPRKAACESRRA